MVNKVLGWIMLVLNILMVTWTLLSQMDMQLWVAVIFLLETYINIKFLESLKK